MRSSAAALLLVALFVVCLAGQQPKNTARISGRVIAAATGRPLARATVKVRAFVNPPVDRTVRTDLNGQYAIADLPAGRYSFVVSRAGYLEQNFDQPTPLARYRMLELADSEQLDGVNFSLHRGAVITGVITDEAGDPLPDVHVETMREIFGPGGRAFAREYPTPVPIQTDDEGRYRVYGLRPGTYVVTATARPIDDSPAGFGRTYYPGTMNESEAQTVRADLGLEAIADFSMIPARHARVSGVVRDSQGRAVTGAYITTNEMRGSRFEPIGGHILKDDGSFEFERMLSGSYVLQVRPAAGRNQVVRADGERATVQLKVTGEDTLICSSPRPAASS